ncbi:30978_t:CDS:2, partial [Gigaspora margarita]
LLQYKTRTGIFNFNLVWNIVDDVDPVAWWQGNFGELASKLCRVASRILMIPSSSAAYNNYKLTCPSLELSDIVKVALCYKDRPRESYEFELLDPNNSNESGKDELEDELKDKLENGLAESNEDYIVKLTESEIEKSNIDSENK